MPPDPSQPRSSCRSTGACALQRCRRPLPCTPVLPGPKVAGSAQCRRLSGAEAAKPACVQLAVAGLSGSCWGASAAGTALGRREQEVGETSITCLSWALIPQAQPTPAPSCPLGGQEPQAASGQRWGSMPQSQPSEIRHEPVCGGHSLHCCSPWVGDPAGGLQAGSGVSGSGVLPLLQQLQGSWGQGRAGWEGRGCLVWGFPGSGRSARPSPVRASRRLPGPLLDRKGIRRRPALAPSSRHIGNTCVRGAAACGSWGGLPCGLGQPAGHGAAATWHIRGRDAALAPLPVGAQSCPPP